MAQKKISLQVFKKKKKHEEKQDASAIRRSPSFFIPQAPSIRKDHSEQSRRRLRPMGLMHFVMMMMYCRRYSSPVSRPQWAARKKVAHRPTANRLHPRPVMDDTLLQDAQQRLQALWSRRIWVRYRYQRARRRP